MLLVDVGLLCKSSQSEQRQYIGMLTQRPQKKSKSLTSTSSHHENIRCREALELGLDHPPRARSKLHYTAMFVSKVILLYFIGIWTYSAMCTENLFVVTREKKAKQESNLLYLHR